MPDTARIPFPVLLAAWDGTVRGSVSAPDRLVKPARAARSVLRPGATAKDLTDAEVRLGTTLPDQYRELLEATDGAYADLDGAVCEHMLDGRRGTDVQGLGLLAAADIRWLHDGAPDVIASMTQETGPHQPLAANGGDVFDTRPLLTGGALMICARWNHSVTALVPVGDTPHWQLWQFHRDEIIGYHSVRSWLEHVTSTPSVEHVMDLIRWRRTRDPRGNDLDRLKDPAALPVLLAALEEFHSEAGLCSDMLLAVGRIKSDTAIPVIETFLADDQHRSRGHAAAALATINTAAARDALARYHRHYQLSRLKDPRAAEAAAHCLDRGDYSGIGLLRDETRFIPHLLRAWNTPRPGQRYMVAVTLYRNTPDRGRPYLHAILDDTNQLARNLEHVRRLLTEGPTAPGPI